MLDSRLQQLADKLSALIARSAYSQSDIARLVGVDRSAVSRWTSGERTPTLQNLVDLAAVLQVDIAELWSGPQAIPTTPEQKAMVEHMAKMDPAQQQAFLALAASFLSTSGSR